MSPLSNAESSDFVTFAALVILVSADEEEPENQRTLPVKMGYSPTVTFPEVAFLLDSFGGMNKMEMRAFMLSTQESYRSMGVEAPL
jgi:hypothetical protein